MIALNNSTQVKIALAWNSEVKTFGDYFPGSIISFTGLANTPASSILTLDHDLHIYDSNYPKCFENYTLTVAEPPSLLSIDSMTVVDSIA